jgi:hypothetical protein
MHLLNVRIQQLRDGPDAGIVDEHCDVLIIPQDGLHLSEFRLVVEVRLDALDKVISRLQTSATG